MLTQAALLTIINSCTASCSYYDRKAQYVNVKCKNECVVKARQLYLEEERLRILEKAVDNRPCRRGRRR
jgi:hypothetical protein